MEQKQEVEQVPDEQMPAAREVFLYFLLLGFINIGGPVAQITMMYNKMVERSHWLSRDRFVKIMGFAHMLPGPEARQLAIYVGYLKKGILGGILAGLTFIIPGALVMIVLSHLYVSYGSLPQVNDILYILKPAVLGIIAAGIIKLGKAAIKNVWLAAILVGAIVMMLVLKIDFLIVLLIAGFLNLFVAEGLPTLKRTPSILPLLVGSLTGALVLANERWIQMAWVFLKTGLFSFGGAYASLVFVQRGAVDQFHWLTLLPLLDIWLGELGAQPLLPFLFFFPPSFLSLWERVISNKYATIDLFKHSSLGSARPWLVSSWWYRLISFRERSLVYRASSSPSLPSRPLPFFG